MYFWELRGNILQPLVKMCAEKQLFTMIPLVHSCISNIITLIPNIQLTFLLRFSIYIYIYIWCWVSRWTTNLNACLDDNPFYSMLFIILDSRCNRYVTILISTSFLFKWFQTILAGQYLPWILLDVYVSISTTKCYVWVIKFYSTKV